MEKQIPRTKKTTKLVPKWISGLFFEHNFIDKRIDSIFEVDNKQVIIGSWFPNFGEIIKDIEKYWL